MEILINRKRAVLKSGTSFEYVAENRLFSGSDSYTLSITFPLRNCTQNIDIFGRINRADVAAQKVIFDCEIIDRSFIRFGSLTITEISQSEVKAQFLEGRSEANFDNSFDDVFINELDLGAPHTTEPSAVTPLASWTVGVHDLSFVALPWVNTASGNIQNCITYANNAYAWHEETTGLSWQPFLLYITKRICSAMGYSYDFTAWEQKEEHRFLLVCNCLPWAWNRPNFAYSMPHWTVAEFFAKLELFLDAEIDIDHRNRSISFAYLAEVINAVAPVCIDRVISEHSVEVAAEDPQCDYREAKNLVYADPGYEMWKYHSCDDFIRAYRRGAVTFDRLSDVLANYSQFALWDGRLGRTDKISDLIYVKGIDAYFVVRAVEKILVQEFSDRPNRYNYKCVLQPVNLFGGRIVDPSEDAEETELDIVPAAIDYTDSTYGRCLFLDFQGLEGVDEVSGSVEIWRNESIAEHKERIDRMMMQPRSVQEIEAGAAQQQSEFYDKIFIAWWDGSTNSQTKGKLPFPFVEDFVIDEDWSGYFRPHTSLRINNATTNALRGVHRIDTQKKYTFKFISDTLPNPRAVFLINGKRFLCEKLTATFTESGLSHLLKGSFWPILET